MAKRSRKVAQEDDTPATGARRRGAAAGMEQRVLAFAKQAGYVAGTIQLKTEGWMDRETLRKQLASVRDGAASLLEQLGNAAGKVGRRKTASPARKNTRSRSGGTVDAPGKKHRKRPPSDPDAALARSQARKMRAATPMEKTARHRQRG
jgi:hypothetical protein